MKIEQTELIVLTCYIVYINQIVAIFLPTAGSGEKVFYGSQHIYCLIRFYFTLYERFVKAREVAREFEINEKTILLPHDVFFKFLDKVIMMFRKKMPCQKNDTMCSSGFLCIYSVQTSTMKNTKTY